MATLREKLNGTIGVFLFFNTSEAKNKLYITVSRKILKYHHYEQTEKLFVFLDNRTEMIRYYSLDQVCNFSFYEENMNNKLEIEIPEGMCIDREHSTFEKIVFKKKIKKKNLTYDEIAEKLFAENGGFFPIASGEISNVSKMLLTYYQPNNAVTEEQLKCILAKNKLANVAKYLNEEWKPDLTSDFGWVIRKDNIFIDTKVPFNIERMGVCCPASSGNIVFKTAEDAKQAIQILGKDEVELALKPLY